MDKRKINKHLYLKKNSVEYFFNAVLYWRWYFELSKGRQIRDILNSFVYVISRLFLSKANYEKVIARTKKNESNLNDFFFDIKHGNSIEQAHRFLSFYMALYAIGLTCIAIVIFFKYFGFNDKFWVFYIILAILLYPVYFYVHSLTISQDKYLIYFKQFDKEDERWKSKWIFITILFFGGGVGTLCIGIFVVGIMIYNLKYG